MNPVKIAEHSINVTYSAINILSNMWYLLDSNKYKKLLKANSSLKDKYLGDRCYILGNGPSIKNVDLSKLEGKNTFVVNGFYESPSFDLLNPKFYVVYDMNEFVKRRNKLQNMINQNANNRIFLFSRKAMGMLENNKNCYYVYSTHMPTKNSTNFDLTKNCNTYMNVVSFCIMCAIYMGFKEIILLGCDFSRFASRNLAHFYDVDKKIQREESLFTELLANAIACKQHEYLRNYCLKKDISVVNATEGSLLDVYPMVNLDDYV